ncbi:hypothetical protein CcaverHIS641_0705920 [Cutaneotrichosporon cavernicola]|nr:hypothetical protein CcaverHIS641_0705920 [Cutaneotrichosporon cavernicola]
MPSIPALAQPSPPPSYTTKDVICRSVRPFSNKSWLRATLLAICPPHTLSFYDGQLAARLEFATPEDADCCLAIANSHAPCSGSTSPSGAPSTANPAAALAHKPHQDARAPMILFNLLREIGPVHHVTIGAEGEHQWIAEVQFFHTDDANKLDDMDGMTLFGSKVEVFVLPMDVEAEASRNQILADEAARIKMEDADTVVHKLGVADSVHEPEEVTAVNNLDAANRGRDSARLAHAPVQPGGPDEAMLYNGAMVSGLKPRPVLGLTRPPGLQHQLTEAVQT